MEQGQSALKLQWAYGVSPIRHNVVNLSASSTDRILFVADHLVVIQVLPCCVHLQPCVSLSAGQGHCFAL